MLDLINLKTNIDSYIISKKTKSKLMTVHLLKILKVI